MGLGKIPITSSPCIDAGDNAAVPLGVTTDLDGKNRFVDDTMLDTGSGPPPIVDMGAFESPGDCNNNLIPDVNEQDSDGDAFIDDCDNCPTFPNTDQADNNGNGVGDVCEDNDGDGILGGNDNCPDDPNAD